MIKKYFITIAIFSSMLYSSQLDGKKVFETYCWGCHHQTAMAFGPPFSQIAKKRTFAEIEAYITSPKSMYKKFGYKRTVMTQFHLSEKEKAAITNYIISYKDK